MNHRTLPAVVNTSEVVSSNLNISRTIIIVPEFVHAMFGSGVVSSKHLADFQILSVLENKKKKKSKHITKKIKKPDPIK